MAKGRAPAMVLRILSIPLTPAASSTDSLSYGELVDDHPLASRRSSELLTEHCVSMRQEKSGLMLQAQPGFGLPPSSSLLLRRLECGVKTWESDTCAQT